MKTHVVDWNCEICGRSGEAEIQSDFSIEDIILEIIIAHSDVSPKCKVEAHMVTEIIERKENNDTPATTTVTGLASLTVKDVLDKT